MADTQRAVSDITGEAIPREDERARLNVVQHPAIDGSVTLTVRDSEVEGILPDPEGFVFLQYFPPQGNAPYYFGFSTTTEALQNAFPNIDLEAILKEAEQREERWSDAEEEEHRRIRAQPLLIVQRHPDITEPITLDLNPAALPQSIPHRPEFVMLTYYPPGEGGVRQSREYYLTVTEFNTLVEGTSLETAFTEAVENQEEEEEEE